jgi:peptidoglycan/LPS O-acetylase OafA/YrhL
VLLVIVFHYQVPGFGGGFVGVDIFFVISGYLITGILVFEVDQHGGINLLHFYGRRARRLLPALSLVALCTLLTSFFVLSPAEFKEVAKSSFAASAYLSNFWFSTRAFDYFAPESGQNPFLHTWSLSVEEQFYFVWPALILVVSRWRRQFLIPALAAVTAGSLLLCILLVQTHQPLAFYLPFTRAWEFGAGALAFVCASRTRNPLLGPIGLALIGISAAFISENNTFPGWLALVPVAGTAAVLVAGQTENGITSLLSSRPLVWLGKLSYSLYLWHWPVIVLAEIVWPDIGAAGRMACALLTLGLAVASFYLIENPVRFSQSFSIGSRSMSLGAGLTFAGMMTATIAWLAANDVSLHMAAGRTGSRVGASGVEY